MTEDLIKLFKCESSFEIRKEIRNITDGFKLDLLVELNTTYYFEYLLKKLIEQVNKTPNESDEVFKKRLNEKELEEVFDYVEFYLYTLENGFLTYNESKLKVQNVSLESYENLKNESYTFEEILNEYLKEIYQNQNTQPEPEAIDLSDTTATEKIIYLHKLGVIDFLRKQEPFNYSINSLATVLSAVIGEKSGTIQPMLNTMLSEFNDQRNNPLNSKKAVPKVEQQLIKIGFKLK
jgi:hypothetical protein